MSVSQRPCESVWCNENHAWHPKDRPSKRIDYSDGELSPCMDPAKADEIAVAINALHAAGIERPEGLVDLVRLVGEYQSELENPVPDLTYRLATRRAMFHALDACREPRDGE